MFTGLVEEKGVILRTETVPDSAGFIEIGAEKVMDDIKIGDSVSVSGVCLTVIKVKDKSFSVEIMPETLRRTNLENLRRGNPVNLERAMRLGDRLGGHIVNGHIDGMGIIRSRVQKGNAVVVEVEAGPEVLAFLAPKGSVALDGISLTVVEVGDNSFTTSIIPHTLRVTTLEGSGVGDHVNVEVVICIPSVRSRQVTH